MKKCSIDTDEIKKLYYPIGFVARKFAVRASCIRFWLQEFDIKVKYNRKGNRYFTERDIEKLTVIHYLLKVRMFKLEGAKQEIKDNYAIFD